MKPIQSLVKGGALYKGFKKLTDKDDKDEMADVTPEHRDPLRKARAARKRKPATAPAKTQTALKVSTTLG